ncbi:MAG: selenocysteine-specific translation elongation factor [Deltaproteobacteria bacterium]
MNAIVGTAGHIDHGKSALVRALTGIDTDRLPEEKRRGISIELGFAWMELSTGDRVGIIDVPGHERFIRQMLAGAQGFDLVIVVVAADDGVMPQTEEHFEIVHLLGVRRAVFAITKCDLADPGRIADVRSEIEVLVAGTDFEEAPVVEVSAEQGSGIEELRQALVVCLNTLERRVHSGPFRMPVDRSFVLKGRGVVVTGTALSGVVSPGDELEVLPARHKARVRDVQVHGADVDSAYAGQRVALSLASVSRQEVKSGSTVVAQGAAVLTSRMDVKVYLRPSAARAVKSYQSVRVYLGTQELRGRMIWLDGSSQLQSPASAYAQIVLDREAVAYVGDRFVIRDETASHTLGGGCVLVAVARHYRRREREDVVAKLEIFERGSDAQRLAVFLELVQTLGAAPSQVLAGIAVDSDRLAALVEDSDTVELPEGPRRLLMVSGARYREYCDAIVETVGSFHTDHPARAGLDLEHLRKSLRYMAETQIFRSVIDSLESKKRLMRYGNVVALPGHSVSMSEDDERLADRILSAVESSGVMPPSLKQLEEDFTVVTRKLSDVIGVLSERGSVVRVSQDLVFARTVMENVESSLCRYLGEHGEITAAGFRDLISTSRKYSIPLLDHFDRSGVTLRSGDYRRLRGIPRAGA